MLKNRRIGGESLVTVLVTNELIRGRSVGEIAEALLYCWGWPMPSPAMKAARETAQPPARKRLAVRIILPSTGTIRQIQHRQNAAARLQIIRGLSNANRSPASSGAKRETTKAGHKCNNSKSL